MAQTRTATDKPKPKLATRKARPKPAKPAQAKAQATRKRRRQYRALVPLNVGLGRRDMGDLVPEVAEWNLNTRRAYIAQEQIEAVTTDEDPTVLHEWIDPDRPEFGTKDDPAAVQAFEHYRAELEAAGLEEPKHRWDGPPQDTAEALHRAQAARLAVVRADEEQAEAERLAEEILASRNRG